MYFHYKKKLFLSVYTFLHGMIQFFQDRCTIGFYIQNTFPINYLFPFSAINFCGRVFAEVTDQISFVS